MAGSDALTRNPPSVSFNPAMVLIIGMRVSTLAIVPHEKPRKQASPAVSSRSTRRVGIWRGPTDLKSACSMSQSTLYA
jgi:hypothetical protein